MDISPQAFLRGLFDAGLAAANPLEIMPAYLPKPPKGRCIVIGAGKAAASMARAVEDNWQGDIEGVVVTRYGYGMPTKRIKVIEAAHPVPDAAGEQAAKEIFKMLEGLTANDLVIALISGGGSALLCAPASCLSADEKRGINKALLRSGANIHEMNAVRKHLSSVKGGRLGLAALPARLETYVISDVPGDAAYTVASGPTLPDPTTLEQALSVIKRYNIPVSDAVMAYLSDPANETPKPDDARFAANKAALIGRCKESLEAAARYAEAHGVKAVIIGDAVEGEARIVGAEHARMALAQAGKGPTVFLSGGETTVTVKGNGRGGRNTEYLLAAALAANADKRIYGLACDTDGIDGSEDNAGAFFTPDTLAAHQGAQSYLDNNDAYSFFEKTGSLIVTGPTCTNVNDFRALLAL